MTTVPAAVADVVAAHATEVFALMGNGNAYLTDALARMPQVHITGLRHEAGTVASADAYHRISRKIAVATTTYGPGFTNTLTPLAEAALARTPLVLVIGGEPTTGPRPWDVDQAALTEALGARYLTVDPASPKASTRTAFELAHSERRPVVLAIPYDLSKAPAPAEATPDQWPPLPEPAPKSLATGAVEEAVRLLSSARRPLVLAGRGARDTGSELGALADILGALTVSSAPARGTFAGREWDLGVCGGFASEDSSKLIRQADVILAVGVGLNQFTTAFGSQFSPEATLIQIDRAPRPTNPRVDLFVRGDSAMALRALLSRLPETGQHPRERWDGIAEHARPSQLTFARDRGGEQAPDGRIDPRAAMSRLDQILPPNRQIVTDDGHFIGWPSYYLDLPSPDSLTMVGTHFQSIGLGFPSAPGALRARPDVTTILVTGDGGGIMGLPDLDSVIRAAASCVVLVLNDAAYGAEIHQYGSQGLDTSLMQVEEADFAKIAEGFGARGLTAETLKDLDEVRLWVSDGAQGTLVVDIRITPTVVAPFMLEIIEATIR